MSSAFSSPFFPAEIELRIFNFLLHTDYRKSAATFLRLSKHHFTTYAARSCHTIIVTETNISHLSLLFLSRYRKPDDYRLLVRRLVFARTCLEESAFRFLDDVGCIKEHLLPNLVSVVMTRQYFAECTIIETDYEWPGLYYVLHHLTGLRNDLTLLVDMEDLSYNWLSECRDMICDGTQLIDSDLDYFDKIFRDHTSRFIDQHWNMAYELAHYRWYPRRIILRNAPRDPRIWYVFARAGDRIPKTKELIVSLTPQPAKWEETIQYGAYRFYSRVLEAALINPEYKFTVQNLADSSTVLTRAAESVRNIHSDYEQHSTDALIQNITFLKDTTEIAGPCDFDPIGGSVDQRIWKDLGWKSKWDQLMQSDGEGSEDEGSDGVSSGNDASLTEGGDSTQDGSGSDSSEDGGSREYRGWGGSSVLIACSM